MASHRPYRPGLGLPAALDEITRRRGTLFAPDVVDACVRVFNERGFQFDNSADGHGVRGVARPGAP